MNRPKSAQETARSSPTRQSHWVPPGVRPFSPARAIVRPMTGTKRNRAVERSHVFVDRTAADSTAHYASPTAFLRQSPLVSRLPSGQSATAVAMDAWSSQYVWVYGSYEYRLQTPYDEALGNCEKLIDRLVERASQLFKQSQAKVQQANAASAVARPSQQSTRVGVFHVVGKSNSLLPRSSLVPSNNASAAASQPSFKIHVILDLVSTKKLIGPIPSKGLPYKLGQDLYRYVDRQFGTIAATTFVGLTDNTARRVGRDVYYTQSDDLTKAHCGFHAVDGDHLFIIFPPSTQPSDNVH